MSGERRDDGTEDEDAPDAVERWVLPYFRDSSLWPVLLVVLAALIAFLASAVLFALRDHEPLGIVTTGLLLVGSLRAARWEWQVRKRFGAIGITLVIGWGIAAVTAWYGARSGLI